MKVTIKPSRLNGKAYAPPSKSYAHRAMICAALSDEKSVIKGISGSVDMKATMSCIEALGSKCNLENDVLTVVPGKKARLCNTVFPCFESGSTLRFFIPTALLYGGKFIFTGSERLIQRGVGVYEDIFSKKGVTFKKGSSEIEIEGELTAGEYEVPGNISSQYISGLLMALALLKEDSIVKVLPPVESRAYIDITIDTMKAFGVKVSEKSENEFHIKGGQSYAAVDLTVEGDWSNAAFFHAFNAVGSDVEICGLNENSVQGDKAVVELMKRLDDDNSEIDISACPDLGPVLFAMAAVKNKVVINGTKRLKIKESDRATAMTDELKKFGIKSEVYENSVVIHGGKLEAPTEELCGHNDHRIVMALAVLASITGGTINEAEAVRKSFPDFFERAQELGLEVKYEI